MKAASGQRAAPLQVMGTPHSEELSDVQILKYEYIRGIVGLQQAENISFSQLNYSLEIIRSAPVPSNKRVHFPSCHIVRNLLSTLVGDIQNNHSNIESCLPACSLETDAMQN